MLTSVGAVLSATLFTPIKAAMKIIIPTAFAIGLLSTIFVIGTEYNLGVYDPASYKNTGYYTYGSDLIYFENDSRLEITENNQNELSNYEKQKKDTIIFQVDSKLYSGQFVGDQLIVTDPTNPDKKVYVKQ